MAQDSFNDLRRAYGESLNHLDDLRRLGGPALASLAGQIQFHLAGMLEAAKRDEVAPTQNPEITKVMKQAASKLLCDAFVAGEGVKSLTQFFHPHASFGAWERLLRDLPHVLKLVTSFNPNAVNMALESDGFVIEIVADEKVNFAQYRQLAYRLTQEFWRLHALLTYELTEQNGQAWISFRVRYANSSSSELDFSVNKLKFDPIFAMYQTTFLQVRALGEHRVVCIDEDASVTVHSRVPEQESNNKTFIHLPFLFRPLSLIITGRGELKTSQAGNQRVQLFNLFR